MQTIVALLDRCTPIWIYNISRTRVESIAEQTTVARTVVAQSGERITVSQRHHKTGLDFCETLNDIFHGSYYASLAIIRDKHRYDVDTLCIHITVVRIYI